MKAPPKGDSSIAAAAPDTSPVPDEVPATAAAAAAAAADVDGRNDEGLVVKGRGAEYVLTGKNNHFGT